MPFTRAAPWLAGMGRITPGADVLAGLTLWGVLVPEALAYAGMAGMPASAGLYTLLASLPLYFLFGGSPVLVCAATSVESIMMAAAVAPLAGGDAARYLTLMALLVATTGIVFLAGGLLRLGRATSFLSKPVMTGFTCGLAIYIAADQLHKLVGLPHGHGDTLRQIAQLVTGIGRSNPATACVGVASLALLFVLERLAPRVPAGLCVLALGLLASKAFALGETHGVAVVQNVRAGLPALALPHGGMADVRAVFPAALGLALVAFSQALGAVRSYAPRFGVRAEPDRELRALGLANLGSALLGGLLAGGSMSSTAVNVAAGARSRVATLVTTVLVVLTLTFFTPVFRGLPEAVLGAVVMHAVVRLFNLSELRRFSRINPVEFALAMLALAGVVLLDILPGLVLAVAASLTRLLMVASDVNLTVMGELAGCGPFWVDTAQHPEAMEVPGVRVLRMDGALFFANAEKFRAAVLSLAGQAPVPGAVAIQLRANGRLCITAADMLRTLARELADHGVRLAFIEPAPATLRMLRQNGVLELVGEKRVYPSIERAVADLHSPIR